MRQWCQAHGVQPPLTREEAENLARNKRYILDQQMRAHNKQVEARKKRQESQLKLVNARRANG